MWKIRLYRTSFINQFALLLLSVLFLAFNKDQKAASNNESTIASEEEQKPPNIILIIVDQFRADASKREGFALNTTPFLDNLAETGAWFNKAYCASPACVPSRTSMMTGRYPSATRVRSNMNVQDAVFKADLVSVLKSKGYSTALIGKNHSYLKPADFDFWKGYNHLGIEKPETPEQEAFAQYLQSTHFYLSREPAPFDASKQLPSQMVMESEHWISNVVKDNKHPFFLYLSIPEPHNPYQVSEPYYSMFPPDQLPPVAVGAEALPVKGNKWVLQHQMLEMGYPGFEKEIPRVRSNYYGMMRLIDDQMKNLVDYLKNQNLYDNTIIIFVADHGDFTGEYGLIKKGMELPECLTRIPMIWHGPGIVKNQLPSAAHVSNVDIMPTICDMLNVDLPEGVQGRSLWPLLTGKQYPKEEFESIIVQQGYGGLHYTDLVEYDPYTDDGNLSKGQIEFDELNTWTQSGMMRSLRKGDWKLIMDMQGKGELYNLAKDGAEVKNLFNDKSYTDKKAELLADMMAWELRLQDPLPQPHPNKKRHYGFKKDKHNYWSPYRNEPERKLKQSIEAEKKKK